MNCERERAGDRMDRMSNVRRVWHGGGCALFLCLLVWPTFNLPAQDGPDGAQKPDAQATERPSAKKPAPIDARLAAAVEGDPITAAEVHREVARVAPNGLPDEQTRARVQAVALQQLIDQRLILRNLARTKVAADPQEIDVMVQRLVKQLDARKLTLADHLASLGVDEAGLRRQIAWQMSWGRYLERYLTDENLQKYFDQHAREFDGSELRVAHILWKVDAKAPREAWQKALDEAAVVRRQIVGGELTFAEAAKKHSQAPTASTGGDIGFIQRRAPMPEGFSKAAYALEKGAVSPPVTSVAGVHLITCLEIKPGMGKWEDARRDVQTALVQYLFQWLADKERSQAKVEFTGALPYLKPGTDELVLPASKD